ncbi:hypothetical protein [Streptomyces sp. NPDC056192]|uniref:hypothetical protein n=1 Tax=Streptomyces sp. NPDC056192 TaxID=3345743 RepID=UPI0035DE45CE
MPAHLLLPTAGRRGLVRGQVAVRFSTASLILATERSRDQLPETELTGRANLAATADRPWSRSTSLPPKARAEDADSPSLFIRRAGVEDAETVIDLCMLIDLHLPAVRLGRSG